MIRQILLMGLLLGWAAGPARAGTEDVVVDRETADAIHGALKYLAAQQRPNGMWTEVNHDEWQTALTGYTLIAFMASGNLPNEGEFAKSVAAGAQYLIDSLKSDGKFITAGKVGHYMYGHGIATIALAELYGQTRDPALRSKLEAAVQVIISSQNKAGGWRYHPVPQDADISVTVLQAVALRAAKEAGLDVPQKTLDGAVKFIHSCYDAKSGGFCYQPKQSPGFARTAAAIYSLQVLGQYDDPKVKTGSTYLQNHQREKEAHFTYGNFYGAPAEYMIGGETWKKWYATLRSQLLHLARRAGDQVYWEPQDKDAGPVYATAVFATILALPYHYMPLYQR